MPTILLIEDDDDARAGFIEFLEKRGYRIVSSTNEQSSIEELANSGLAVELILVNQKMSSTQAIAVGRRVRDHFKMSKNIPVVVIPLEFRSDLEGTDQAVGGTDYITYFADAQQLEQLLSRLLGGFQ